MPPVDQALPELLIDLEERGLLDTTLVVWLTDFGRTPKINSASGRDHWASAGFAIMAGAGVPGGAVLGATDDEGGRPIARRVLQRGHRRHDLHQARHPARPDRPHPRRPPDPPARRPAHPIREWM